MYFYCRLDSKKIVKGLDDMQNQRAKKELKNCFFRAATNRHWRQWAHSS